MAHEREIPGTPEEWLIRAKSNLAMARQPKLDPILFEDYCHQAHQAAEKALKAIYRSRSIAFGDEGDIGKLLKGLEKKGLVPPPEVLGSSRLTQYLTQTRFPGKADPVDENEFQKALGLAQGVVSWACQFIQLKKQALEIKPSETHSFVISEPSWTTNDSYELKKETSPVGLMALQKGKIIRTKKQVKSKLKTKMGSSTRKVKTGKKKK
jgi:HEPN domain-containing protein